MKNKKLYRSDTDKKLFGVCGGLAEYLEIDSTVIRLIWVVASLFWGFGLIGYLICALIIPAGPTGINPPEQERKYKKPPCEF